LLLETGVRAQKLLSINVEDVDFSDSSILVRQGKETQNRVYGINSMEEHSKKI